MAAGEARIAEITLDERTVVRRNPAIEHERAVAIADLLDENRFWSVGGPAGPYNIRLSVEENRLNIDIAALGSGEAERVTLALSPFRGIIKDYFLVCESYFKALSDGGTTRIEAIDMGRRGLHDEAAVMLQERMSGRIEMDHPTARRLFTLICVLHIR